MKDPPGASAHAEFADDRQHQVLGGHSGPQAAAHVDRQRSGASLKQALRRQHMAHLGGSDAESQCAERAVGAGVAVSANHGVPGPGSALFGADNVHDSAFRAAQTAQLDPELLAILDHCPNLGRRRGQRHLFELFQRGGRRSGG